jgi:hypothetical protein
MTSEVMTSTAGYWYEDSAVSAVDVLNALRRYRTAESAAQRRAREALGIGENALLALRFLIDAEHDGRTVNAKDLAERLEITAASTSALVDRLVRSGHVERSSRSSTPARSRSPSTCRATRWPSSWTSWTRWSASWTSSTAGRTTSVARSLVRMDPRGEHHPEDDMPFAELDSRARADAALRRIQAGSDPAREAFDLANTMNDEAVGRLTKRLRRLFRRG